MKYLLLAAIRIYWLIPKRIKNKCLYKETCSRYVYRITREHGITKGIEALRFRTTTCRPNYRLLDIDGQRVLICNNGQIIQSDDLAKWLKDETSENNR